MQSRIIWAAIAMAPISLMAQQAPDDAELPPITVTADPFADRSPVEATQPTDVLSDEELQRARGNTLGESLAAQPGVHSADFGAGSSRPVIRGLGGPRIRILDGGSGVVDASTISPDHNVSTEPFRARQIEVLKGPASLIYGSGAIGGVINVVTDLVPTLPSHEWHGSVGLRGSSVDDGRSAFGHVGGGNGQFAFHLDGLSRETEDYAVPGFADSDGAEAANPVRGRVENSATRTDSAGAGLAWTGQRGYLGLGWSAYDSNYGVPGHGHEEETQAGEPATEGEHAEEGGVRIDLAQRRAELRGGFRPAMALIERLRGSFVVSQYRHAEIEPEAAPAGEAGAEEEAHDNTVFRNDGQELRLEFTHRRIGGWRGVFGAQGLHQEFVASGEEAFVPPVDTQSLGLFLVEEFQLGAHRLSFGGRAESVAHDTRGNPDRDFDLLGFSGGLHVELGASQHLNLNVSHAQRAPDVQELYSDGPHLATASFERGDPDLQRETAVNVDLGWAADFGDWHLGVDLFHTHYRDFIYTTEVDADGDGNADFVGADGSAGGDLLRLDFTQNDASFRGAEAEIRWQPHTRLAIGLFGDTVRAERSGGPPLPRIPAARLGLSLDGDVGAWRYGARAVRTLQQDRTAPLETASDAYTLLSADLAWHLPTAAGDLILALRGRNLLDEEARNHVSVLKDLAPLPGRSLILDLDFAF